MRGTLYIFPEKEKPMSFSYFIWKSPTTVQCKQKNIKEDQFEIFLCLKSVSALFNNSTDIVLKKGLVTNQTSM